MIIKLYFVCAARTHMYGVQMKAEIESVKQAALAAIDAADSVQQLGEVRVRFLGKSGELTSLMKGLGALSKEERPEMGRARETGAPQCGSGGRHSSRQASRARHAASHHAGEGGHRARLPRHGVRGGGRSRDRERPLQLPAPQRPQGSSRTRHAGHLLRSASSSRAGSIARTTTPRTAPSSTR